MSTYFTLEVCFINQVDPRGIEPLTSPLRPGHSTSELQARNQFKIQNLKFKIAIQKLKLIDYILTLLSYYLYF